MQRGGEGLVGWLCSFLSVTGTGQARSKQARQHTRRRGTAKPSEPEPCNVSAIHTLVELGDP